MNTITTRVFASFFSTAATTLLLVLVFNPAHSQNSENAGDGSTALEELTNTARDAPPNFIILIGDDMAVETLDCYGVGSATAVTPNLDSLCAAGMRFDNFWAQPVCSPTRATILSGRYGFRTGVGTPARSGIPALPVPEKAGNAHKELDGGGPPPRGAGGDVPAPGLRADEFTLPMALKADVTLGYETAAIGKWHLADQTNGAIEHPNLAGFDHYTGSVRTGGVESYFAWSKVINGEVTDGKTGWADSDKVDDAIAWLDQRSGEKPWLLWMAFNAPHTPFHLPPLHLLKSDARNLDPDAISDENQHAYYNAMIEALDTEIGRLLAHLSEAQRANTYIVFVGDNGTPEQVAMAPFDFTHSKGSISQGGVNVPFFFVGPGIEKGRVSKALANSVDIFATLLELAGIDSDAILPNDRVFDTVSLTPILFGESEAVRDYAYADVFGSVPRGVRGERKPEAVSERTIRDQSYKLFVSSDREEFYDLTSDPFEKNNLLNSELTDAAARSYESLSAQLAQLLASEPE